MNESKIADYYFDLDKDDHFVLKTSEKGAVAVAAEAAIATTAEEAVAVATEAPTTKREGSATTASPNVTGSVEKKDDIINLDEHGHDKTDNEDDDNESDDENDVDAAIQGSRHHNRLRHGALLKQFWETMKEMGEGSWRPGPRFWQRAVAGNETTTTTEEEDYSYDEEEERKEGEREKEEAGEKEEEDGHKKEEGKKQRKELMGILQKIRLVAEG